MSPAEFNTLRGDLTAGPTITRFSLKKSGRRNRGIDYPLHPITDEYADFTPEELEALRKSLREHGRLLVPIVIWREQIVDGKHRRKVCKEEGIRVRYDDITQRCPTEDDMRAHVSALNEHRRANTKRLTAAEKRARVEAALKGNPERSDRQIAGEIGVSPTTAGKVRSDLEAKGDVSRMDTRTDTKGRKQSARKPKRGASKKQKSPVLNDAPDDVAQPVLELMVGPVNQVAAPPMAPDQPTPAPVSEQVDIPSPPPVVPPDTLKSSSEILEIALRVRASIPQIPPLLKDDVMALCDWTLANTSTVAAIESPAA